MKVVLSVMAAMLIIAAPALAGNWVTNGDFETGDLTGWSVHVPSGPQSLPVQVFSAADPMDVTEVYQNPDPEGPEWLMRDSGVDATVPLPAGDTFSAGWARTGPYENQEQHAIYQTWQVAPGTYFLTFAFDCVVYVPPADDDPTYFEPWGVGARPCVLVNGDYRMPGRSPGDPNSRRVSVWNQDCNDDGTWVTRYLIDEQITTDDGNIELRLMMHDKFNNTPPAYEYVAYDNVYMELAGVPEPGSLATLGGALLGLAGMAIRRRK